MKATKKKTLPRLTYALRLTIMQRLGQAERAGRAYTLAGLIGEYRGSYAPAQVREAVEELVDLDHAQVYPGAQTGQVMVRLSRRMRGVS